MIQKVPTSSLYLANTSKNEDHVGGSETGHFFLADVILNLSSKTCDGTGISRHVMLKWKKRSVTT